ncbi:MAG: TIR domain-containing protein [Steroidobacteraceae bacterium]|nr:nucleotide-binding protein [Pseudomonadota bacterium]
MKKRNRFINTFFPVEAIARALALMQKAGPLKIATLSVSRDVDWWYDTLEEFYADYRESPSQASLRCRVESVILNMDFYENQTQILVEAESRAEIEQIFRIFEDAAPTSAIPPPIPPKPIIFIGHGRSPLWRDLKDHLHEKHEYKIEAYEIGARAGHTIRDILDRMLHRSTFALLVMTAEDEHADNTQHARENVIHELGLFQGHLGFTRAVVLLEEGSAEFSNIHGIHQIRFAKGNIKETYGEVLATLRREFNPITARTGSVGS